MSPLDGVKDFVSSHTDMSFTKKQLPHEFPAIPSSLTAGDHEMREWPAAKLPPTANTLPYHTPYLGLQARLSQVVFNRWTVLLILVICRLLLSIKDINYDIANAKAEALSACTSVENAGSTMASMPHYLSEGVNAMAADGVTKAVNGLMSGLQLTVTGVEELVVFYVNMLTSTYVCLITLVISGSLQVAIQMIEDVGAFMNKSIASITGTMASDIGNFENDLNSFLSDINIGGIIGGGQSQPTINLNSSITALTSIQVDPTTMDSDLNKLNANIPTFAQVQNFTNNVLRLPFEEVKTLINSSVAAYTFDKSVFPVAQKKALTFCSDNPALDNFFDALVKAIYTARTVFIAVLTILAVAVCVPMGFLEIRRWRQMQERATLIKENAIDKMDAIYIASRPYTATAGLTIAKKFKSSKRKILARWFVAYITSLPVLFVLALGIAGLFGCLCQYIVLQVIDKEAPKLAAEVGNFSQQVVSALDEASTAWAVDANGVINSTNTLINKEVFGWVNTTTHALNDTLNAFSDQMSTALNDTFGGTILYDPISQALNCLIGLKIAGIETGLTWVSDNAYVTFPEFRTDVFSLGASASLSNSSSGESFLSAPGDVASDSITSAVVKVSNKLASGIREEAIIYTCVVLVWVLAVLAALASAIYFDSKKEKTRGEGRPDRSPDYVQEQQSHPQEQSPSYSEAVGEDGGGFMEGKYSGRRGSRDVSPASTAISHVEGNRRLSDPFRDDNTYEYAREK